MHVFPRQCKARTGIVDRRAVPLGEGGDQGGGPGGPWWQQEDNAHGEGKNGTGGRPRGNLGPFPSSPTGGGWDRAHPQAALPPGFFLVPRSSSEASTLRKLKPDCPPPQVPSPFIHGGAFIALPVSQPLPSCTPPWPGAQSSVGSAVVGVQQMNKCVLKEQNPQDPPAGPWPGSPISSWAGSQPQALPQTVPPPG